MLDDEKKACLREIDYDLVVQFEFIPVTKWDHRRQKRRLTKRNRKLAKFRKKHGDLTLTEVEKLSPEIARIIKENQARPRENEAFKSIEKRMFCDSHVRKRFRHKKGKRDEVF